jgi:hypothetical protein
MSESMMILMIPLMEQTKHDNNDDGRWLLYTKYGWVDMDKHIKVL